MEGDGKLESVGLKRKRSGNYSAKERGLLVELVGRYAGVIECKKTDGTTMKEKEKAWQQVAEEYNGQVETAKEWKNLKTLFENIKKASKKAAAEEKVCRMKTGGGSCETVLDLETEKVLAILGNRARPLVNMFDGDAEYNGDSVFQYQPDIFHLDAVDDASFGVLQPTEFTAMSDGAGTSVITVHTVASEPFLTTDAEAAEIVPSTSRDTAVPLSHRSHSGVVYDARKWAGKRKPRPCVAEHRTVATDNISALAVHQIAYYTEKLAMEKAEHTIRMEVLAMEKKLMAKRLAAFGPGEE